MKKSIHEKLANKGIVPPPTHSPRPVYRPTAFDIRQALIDTNLSETMLAKCMDDVREGRVHKIKEIADMLRCHPETVLRLFKRVPGTFKIRSEYRVPQTILNQILREMLVRR